MVQSYSARTCAAIAGLGFLFSVVGADDQSDIVQELRRMKSSGYLLEGVADVTYQFEDYPTAKASYQFRYLESENLRLYLSGTTPVRFLHLEDKRSGKARYQIETLPLFPDFQRNTFAISMMLQSPAALYALVDFAERQTERGRMERSEMNTTGQRSFVYETVRDVEFSATSQGLVLSTLVNVQKRTTDATVAFSMETRFPGEEFRQVVEGELELHDGFADSWFVPSRLRCSHELTSGNKVTTEIEITKARLGVTDKELEEAIANTSLEGMTPTHFGAAAPFRPYNADEYHERVVPRGAQTTQLPASDSNNKRIRRGLMVLGGACILVGLLMKGLRRNRP